METRAYLLNELQEIEKWEKDQKGLWFWEKIGRLPFKMLDKVTPKFLQDKIGTLLDELGSYIQTGGQYLSNEKSVFQYIEKKTGQTVSELADLQGLPVEAMKQVSLELAEQRKTAATIQGAGSGFGGIFTLAIDIPAILAISLKTLQEIAIIHGYDPNDKNERVFILKCLQFSSADIVGKQAILNELSDFSNGPYQSREVLSQMQGWREVALSYKDSFGWKKLFQMVPVAGILFGAFANRSMISDLSETGIMLYQKRKIIERLASVQA
ncbi:EcsC family protein [Mesobacillus zeae]|uniref:EcsC family protein n=1 Tax=Mesobacillus zeae TaxID=1917180 RepID=A0A398B3G3_9BACI|nr:EcsC family protein [Mesobacillus zeae]RID82490.1 EcsC family protein [Mesobacillus zeae]